MIETWRAAYRMMQELGIKFEAVERIRSNMFTYIGALGFSGEQHHYRIAPDQIAPTNWPDIYRAAQSLGVKFDYKTMENEQWVEVGHSEPFMVLCFHRYRLHIEEPQKRTIEINGVKVKALVDVIWHEHNTGKIVWLYSNSADAEDARAAIIAALEGKK